MELSGVNRTDEAGLFGRYITGRDVPAALAARYEAACAELGLSGRETASSGEDAVVAFVLRHPWSIGPLDAFCGVFRPKSLLRRKLLVMAAILEASPEFAEVFLPRDMIAPALVLELIGAGARSALKLMCGVLVYPFAARVRHG